MTELKYFIEEDDTTVKVQFDVAQLKSLMPLCVASTVETIRQNFDNSKFVQLDKLTAEYVLSVTQKTNNAAFNQLLELYTTGLLSYYYTHLDPELYTKFQTIYNLEPLLHDFVLPSIGYVAYRIQLNELYFDNTLDLVAQYGKGIVLYLAQILIQNLKHEHRVKTGNSIDYYLSSEIKIATFNSETNLHERVPQFSDDRYFLNPLFLSGCLSLGTNMKKILEMILIQQHVVAACKHSVSCT